MINLQYQNLIKKIIKNKSSFFPHQSEYIPLTCGSGSPLTSQSRSSSSPACKVTSGLWKNSVNCGATRTSRGNSSSVTPASFLATQRYTPAGIEGDAGGH